MNTPTLRAFSDRVDELMAEEAHDSEVLIELEDGSLHHIDFVGAEQNVFGDRYIIVKAKARGDMKGDAK